MSARVPIKVFVSPGPAEKREKVRFSECEVQGLKTNLAKHLPSEDGEAMPNIAGSSSPSP
jgi:hypothetical protein